MGKGQSSQPSEIFLAENLKRLIREKGVPVSSLAKKLGINKTTLHNYCNGVLPRNLNGIIKLAGYFNLSLGELLYGMDESKFNQLARIEILDGQYEIIVRPINKQKVKSAVRV